MKELIKKLKAKQKNLISLALIIAFVLLGLFLENKQGRLFRSSPAPTPFPLRPEQQNLRQFFTSLPYYGDLFSITYLVRLNELVVTFHVGEDVMSREDFLQWLKKEKGLTDEQIAKLNFRWVRVNHNRPRPNY